MTARLRVLPISTRDVGQPQHYLILDRLRDLPGPLQDGDVDKLEELARRSGGVAITFGFPVDLPDVDEDPEGAWAEMVRAEHAREQAYKAAHWEADPDTPGAVRKREAATPASAPEEPEDAWLPAGYAREDVLALIRRQESSVETVPAPACRALREVEHSGWVACDGTGHDREHHSGRLTAGPFVGQRWVWPFGPTDHAKREEDRQRLTLTVDVPEAYGKPFYASKMLEVLRAAGAKARV